MERFIDTFFKPSVIASTWPKIVDGMLITVELAIVVVLSGLAFGLLLALLRTAQVRVVNALIIVFVDVLRALPPLVMVLIVYFGLPNVGLTLPSFAVLWLVLAAVLAAFAEEIFWAGILSVRRGQWDAARSTGLTFTDTLVFVVMPQTIRMVLPPLVNRIRLWLVDVASLVFCAFFSWKSWTLAHEAWVDGQVSNSMWSPPLAIPYVLMASGMTLLCVQILLQLAIPLSRPASR